MAASDVTEGEWRTNLAADVSSALGSLAPRLESRPHRWMAMPFYDGLSGALIWTDEWPDVTVGSLQVTEVGLLRLLLAYRGSLIAGAPILEWSACWNDAQRAAPSWPGFRRRRCRRSRVLARYQSRAAEAFLSSVRRWEGDP